jgi:hypothetical protein
MSQPTINAVHVNTPLTNISVAFLQNATNFIAGSVFPNVPVMFRSDRYYTFDRGYFNRDEAQERAPGAESAGSGFSLDNTPTYYARVFAHHHDIADQIRANADPQVDMDRMAAELVAHKLLIKREKSWVSKFFAGGIWTGGDVDGVSGAPSGAQVRHWSDYTNGDPIADVDAAKAAILESTGIMPNTLVLGYRVFDALKRHPDIIDLIKYSGGVSPGNPALITPSALAAVFGVERVMIASAIENTGLEGQANSHSFIAGKKALLCYAAPSAGLMTPTAGYTFSWNGFMGQTNPNGFATKRFYLDKEESTRVEGQMAYDQKVISSELGYFFDSIVA